MRNRLVAGLCGLGVALLVATPSSVNANYTCPGNPTSYVTDCTGQSNGTACISPVTNLGCCGPGSCKGGNCDIPAMQTACHDSNACTNDICTTAGGGNNDPICSFPAISEGGSCDADGNPCTLDTCQSGTCTFVSNKDCSAQGHDPQCQVAACNTSTGNCYAQDANEGQKCNDGYDCTYGERCNNGSCGTGAGTGFFRSQGTQCFDHDWCRPGTCDGDAKPCHNRTNLAANAPCDPNDCTNAFCASAGGNCVVASCNTTPPKDCAQCGHSNCVNQPNNTTFPCGCLSEVIYSPPNN